MKVYLDNTEFERMCKDDFWLYVFGRCYKSENLTRYMTIPEKSELFKVKDMYLGDIYLTGSVKKDKDHLDAKESCLTFDQYVYARSCLDKRIKSLVSSFERGDLVVFCTLGGKDEDDEDEHITYGGIEMDFANIFGEKYHLSLTKLKNREEYFPTQSIDLALLEKREREVADDRERNKTLTIKDYRNIPHYELFARGVNYDTRIPSEDVVGFVNKTYNCAFERIKEIKYPIIKQYLSFC